MTKKILVISGHYGEKRFGQSLADSYEEGAKAAGAEVRRINAQDLQFNPVLQSGDFKGEQPFEEDLRTVQEALKWCNHLVLVYPLWWGDMPGHLKSLLDRTLLPGFAFQYKKGSPFPEKLLKGRTARVMITSDTPGWYLKWIYGAGSNKAVKKQILDFVGFEKNRFDLFGPIKDSQDNIRGKWQNKAQNAGIADAA